MSSPFLAFSLSILRGKKVINLLTKKYQTILLPLITQIKKLIQFENFDLINYEIMSEEKNIRKRSPLDPKGQISNPRTIFVPYFEIDINSNL